MANEGFSTIKSFGIGGIPYSEYHRPIGPLLLAVDSDGVTYTPITGMGIGLRRGFAIEGDILRYLGPKGVFLINGTSDLEVNKALDITYALHVNGEPVPTELTTVSFSSSGKKRNISITAIAEINSNDTIEVRVKGDGTMGATVTINKLDLTFFGSA